MMTSTLSEQSLPKQIIAIAIFAVVFMPAGIPVDYVVDPAHFEIFAALRAIYSLIILIGLGVFVQRGSQLAHYRKFGLFIYICTVVTILSMCVMTSEKYPYHVGLSTIFFAASILMVWPLRYFLIPMLVTAVLMIIAEWKVVGDMKTAVTGIFLMINVTAMSTLASWMAYRNFETSEALLARLDDLSNTDRLTGLANRRAFDLRLQTELTRASRDGAMTTVMLIDVDYFKQYNDRYGHQQGDECLRRVGDCLRRGVTRESDFVARYGGEEFVVVLPNLGARGAEAVASRIAAKLDEAGIAHAASPAAPFVTVSMGIACGKAMSAQDLLAKADAALYTAKRTGRNRMVVDTGCNDPDTRCPA